MLTPTFLGGLIVETDVYVTPDQQIIQIQVMTTSRGGEGEGIWKGALEGTTDRSINIS